MELICCMTSLSKHDGGQCNRGAVIEAGWRLLFWLAMVGALKRVGTTAWLREVS